jgi:hypothetical protein
MADGESRESYIPYRKADVVELCIRDGRLAEADQKQFREFCRILESLFHFEFHKDLERLKTCYASFDPDADTRSLEPIDGDERRALQEQFLAGLSEILVKANYRRVTEEELQWAVEEESLFRIRLHVDFDDFADVILFRRGQTEKRETLKRYWGLRTEEIRVPTFERVAIYVRFKDAESRSNKKSRATAFRPGSTILKLFRSIPKADLEMLFPNTEVRMKPVDKVYMGAPAVAGAIVVIATKLGAVLSLVFALFMFWLGVADKEPGINSAQLVALAVGLGTLAGYLFKQWTKYKNRKIRFMKALTDNLYFKNLDNNVGVFHHLIDDAEEEECKEAMLAYYFLLTEKRELDKAALDDAIENWFASEQDCCLDFDVGDALGKLERLGLAERTENTWRVLPLAQAKIRLDEIWDHYFEWNGSPT